MIHQATGSSECMILIVFLIVIFTLCTRCHSKRLFLVSPVDFLSLELSNRSPRVTLRTTSAALKAVLELSEAGHEVGEPGGQGGEGVLVVAVGQLLLTYRGTDPEVR